MTEEIQDRIREAAYLMWESAGRQHGMATEYWLKAESDMLSTVQAATAKMISSLSPVRDQQPSAPPPAIAAAERPAHRPEPARASIPVPPTTLKTPVESVATVPADAPVTPKQPAARKPADRSKEKA